MSVLHSEFDHEPESESAGAPFVLFICTGNICRSPMAEFFFRTEMARRGRRAEVRSAGLVYEGRPADPKAVKVMGNRGIDLGGHRASLLTDDMIDQAVLVLGMTREHVRHVVMRRQDAFPKAYNLRTLVRRAERHGPPPSDRPLREWMDRLGEGRGYGELIGDDPTDDIDDPYGRSKRRFEKAASELEESIRRLVEILVPSPTGDRRG